MEKELEAKYFIDDKDLARFLLKNIGLDCIKSEFLMRRKTFCSTTEPGWMKVRDDERTTLTFKQITGKDINDINEVEIIANDFKKVNIIN